MTRRPQNHLHWTQRIALTQHNLHTAPRTSNYAFFSTLQAHYYLDGHDPVAALNDTLGDDADRLFTVLDNLSSGIAWAYEDAFKNVYDNLRVLAASPSMGTDTRDHLYVMHARLQSDIAAQRVTADTATDKLISNAITLIQQQPLSARDDAAHVLCLGASFVADAIQVCLSEFDTLGACISTSSSAIERDEVWNRADNAYAEVRFSVSSATCALKGILNMMESHDDPAGEAAARALHSEEALIPSNGGRSRGISTSTESSSSGASVQGWNVFRRMSTVMTGAPSRKASMISIAAPSSNGVSSSCTIEGRPRKSSIASIAPVVPTDTNQVDFATSTTSRTASPLRSPPSHRKRPISTSGGTVLSPIPPTPATENLFNPFESSFISTSDSQHGNETAWSANNDNIPTTPISPSCHPSPGSQARPNPTPEQQGRRRAQSRAVSNDAITRTPSGHTLILGMPSNAILDASAGDMGPGPALGPTRHTVSSPPPSGARGSFGRRRSTTVTGQPPTPEELFPGLHGRTVLQAEEAVVFSDDTLAKDVVLSLFGPLNVVPIGLGCVYVYLRHQPALGADRQQRRVSTRGLITSASSAFDESEGEDRTSDKTPPSEQGTSPSAEGRMWKWQRSG